MRALKFTDVQCVAVKQQLTLIESFTVCLLRGGNQLGAKNQLSFGKVPEFACWRKPLRRLSCPGGGGAVWRDEDVLLVGPAAPDELLDNLRGVELPGDGDESAVVLAEALALQAQPLGDPGEHQKFDGN